MNWSEEVALILQEARADVALAVALMALRKAENGAPGREFGVLSTPAPTYHDQLHVAGNSFRNAERRARDLGQVTREDDGLFTEGFLRGFSAHWAPLAAENDPHGLNANHATNLATFARSFGERALAGLRLLA